MSLTTAAVQRLVLKRSLRSLEVGLPLLVVLALDLTVVTHARLSTLVALDICAMTLLALAVAGVVVRRRRLPDGMAPATALAGVGLFLALLNLSYARNVAVAPLSKGLAEQARAIVAAAPADRLLVVDVRILKEALHYPSARRIEDTTVRNAWPDFFAEIGDLPANEYWIMTREALLYRVAPSRLLPYRGIVDRLFIATGMPPLKDDGICVIDPAVVNQQWDGSDPDSLLALACRPAP